MFSWCWFELMINCSSTLCFLPTSSIFRKISICSLHYCWLQLLSCLGLVFVDLQSIYSTVAVRRNAGSANSVPGFCFCQVSNLAHSWCADAYIHVYPVYPVFAPKNVPHPESLQCSSGIFCFSSGSCFVLRNAWHKPVKTIAIFGSFDQVCMLTVRWWRERCLKDHKNQNLPQVSKPLSSHVFVM